MPRNLVFISAYCGAIYTTNYIVRLSRPLFFFQVERIVDKRKNKRGKWEYLIRWKGYGSKEDTWEPEHHLLHCEEFIDQFNSLRLHGRRPKPAKHGGTGLRRGGGGPGLTTPQKPRKMSASKLCGDRVTKPMTYKSMSAGLQFGPPIRGPTNGLQNGEGDPLHYRTTARGQGVPSSRVEKVIGDMEPSGAMSQLGNELGTPIPNGDAHLHSSAKRKLAEDKGYVFDKRLRYNVRQNETSYRFRDIVVRKEEGFTHVLLSSQTSDNNALTPEIMKEVCRALGSAAGDDSKLLLLSAVGSVFCGGLDPSYLIGRLSTDRRKESSRIADAVRDFVKAFIHFKKPIVVAINGPALGLGASILPLCDIVWASERAWFQTPCAALRLTPSGCSSYTFPQILGVALANEMLFCGRKLTAQEACSRGLVSQVFWPTTFNQEVMLRVQEMAACSAVVLEESKCMVRSILKSVLEEVNEKECQMLKQLWCSTKGLEALFNYLQNKGYDA
uniref:Chromo domain-containing protein n=1 Tax=Electrophorus electricus TaxID=8005 RepID=A0A4W4GDS2_ELEEL